MGTSVSMEHTALVVKVEAPHAASYLLGSNIQIISAATMSLEEAFLLLIKFKIVLWQKILLDTTIASVYQSISHRLSS
jgi:hypothetical protein